jgi:hypothetical protein
MFTLLSEVPLITINVGNVHLALYPVSAIVTSG